MTTENLTALLINALQEARYAGTTNADRIDQTIELGNVGIKAGADGFLVVTDDGQEFLVTITPQ